MLSVENLVSIFGNIDTLIGMSRMLLAQLEDKMKIYLQDRTSDATIKTPVVAAGAATDMPSALIGDVMVEFASTLKNYNIYCSNQENSLLALEQLRSENLEFDILLKKKEYTPDCNNLNIASFLVKPLSRINKYPSLVR